VTVIYWTGIKTRKQREYPFMSITVGFPYLKFLTRAEVPEERGYCHTFRPRHSVSSQKFSGIVLEVLCEESASTLRLHSIRLHKHAFLCEWCETHFACLSAPLLLYSSTPLLLYSSTPLLLCSSTTHFHCSSFPQQSYVVPLHCT
jgi:hypothetical protein